MSARPSTRSQTLNPQNIGFLGSHAHFTVAEMQPRKVEYLVQSHKVMVIHLFMQSNITENNVWSVLLCARPSKHEHTKMICLSLVVETDQYPIKLEFYKHYGGQSDASGSQELQGRPVWCSSQVQLTLKLSVLQG